MNTRDELAGAALHALLTSEAQPNSGLIAYELADAILAKFTLTPLSPTVQTESREDREKLWQSRPTNAANRDYVHVPAALYQILCETYVKHYPVPAVSTNPRTAEEMAWDEGWNAGWDGRMLYDFGDDEQAKVRNPYSAVTPTTGEAN